MAQTVESVYSENSITHVFIYSTFLTVLCIAEVASALRTLPEWRPKGPPARDWPPLQLKGLFQAVILWITGTAGLTAFAKLKPRLAAFPALPPG
jgi:hypothetical protein